MSSFTYWKGVADAAVGVILLTKPELIYESTLAKFSSQASGLRLPNPHPTAEGEISSQHAVAIMVCAFVQPQTFLLESRRVVDILIIIRSLL